MYKKFLRNLLIIFSLSFKTESSDLNPQLALSYQEAIDLIEKSSVIGSEKDKLLSLAKCIFFKQECHDAYIADLISSTPIVIEYSPEFQSIQAILNKYYNQAQRNELFLDSLHNPEGMDLAKKLITNFSLSAIDAERLYQFINFVELSTTDHESETLYLRLVQTIEEQLNAYLYKKAWKNADGVYMYPPAPIELISKLKKYTPLEMAAKNWLEWWNNKHTKENLEDLLAELRADTIPITPTVPPVSESPSPEEISSSLKKLQERLAALRAMPDIKTVGISPAPEEPDSININNLVELEAKLNESGQSYNKLITITMEAKQKLINPIPNKQNLVEIEFLLVNKFGINYVQILKTPIDQKIDLLI